MSRNDAALNGRTTDDVESLPHLVTVVGHGVPSNFEITVNGEIELADDDPVDQTTVVSSHAVEGTIATGVTQFRFSGELANAHTGDWNDSSPTIHVEYGRK
ncbi:hypothetical protein [Natronococcus wangiae]|uniref:hypothetical protein n=1 Tax=Natronococcus wangiae TaxID=3068275 RepID=UPI00273EB062|nr:hypothetical protein [Natronococcus sp. AD5]